MLKALIFDFDGVIIDTELARFLSWKEAFSWYGIDLKKEEWLQYLGIPGIIFDPIKILSTKIGKKINREDVDIKRKPIFWNLAEKMTINPGVLDYLKEAEKLEIKLAIASSSEKKWVVEYLIKLKIRDFFQVLKNSDDVEKIKPYPDLYLEALKALKIEKKEAIAIEDSEVGAEAAKKAGIFCVFVPNGLNKGMKNINANINLDSLSDLPFNKLCEIFNKNE
jgi:putative hydrolase of the HAD superfamily